MRSQLFVVSVALAAMCMGAGKCSDPPPAPAQTACEAACANLTILGCAEGINVTCVPTCQKVQDGHLTDLKPAKLAAAGSVAEVQAIGTVGCTEDLTKKAPATCANACANIKHFGCPEADTCLATCTHAVAQHLTDFKLPCLVAAKTKAALQRCGSVACP